MGAIEAEKSQLLSEVDNVKSLIISSANNICLGKEAQSIIGDVNIIIL